MSNRKPLRQAAGLALAVFLLVGCGGAQPESTATPMPPNTGLITGETRREGESLAFSIDDTVYLCTDEMPYTIVQTTEGRERVLMLEHSCLRFAGTGVDQYCENGQVKIVEVGNCSDAIFCEDTSIRETVTWDQQEYVELSEECGSETIHREAKQQVPEGKYQVMVRVTQNDEVVTKVIKEFTIISNESDPVEPVGSTIEQAVASFLELWMQVPYRNEQIEFLEDDGTISKARVVDEFNIATDLDWIMREATVECQRRGTGWLCDKYSYFQPLPRPTSQVFEYPRDGHPLDYAGSYLFKVRPIEGADSYLWSFFQNGVLEWQNLRDEKQLSGNEYGIHPESAAHGKFVPGELEVWVRASINGRWTDAIIITTRLR